MEAGSIGLKYTILRPNGVYGPRYVDDVSYCFIMYVLKGGPMSKLIPGDDNHLVHLTYVEDMVQGHVLALEKEQVVNETYVIGSDQPLTYNQAYEIISKLGGKYQSPGGLGENFVVP